MPIWKWIALIGHSLALREFRHFVLRYLWFEKRIESLAQCSVRLRVSVVPIGIYSIRLRRLGSKSHGASQTRWSLQILCLVLAPKSMFVVT